MQPKVSIIVPIYNMEMYLKRCLDSLLKQDLTDIEIIAVDDGSSDSSLSILKDYADKDCRIKIIDKDNEGVSAARNQGIFASCGTYIGFVDPDDWIEQDMYQSLYDTAVQDDADIVMCSYIREFGSHSKEKIFPYQNKICFENEEVHSVIMRRLVGPLREEIANPEYLDAWGTVWCKLYRADLIKQNQLSFTDLRIVGTNEDSLFNIHACYYAKKFVFINKPYYHYWRANTQSVTAGYKPDLINQWFSLYAMIETFLCEKEANSDFYKALQNRICLGTLGLGLNTISKANTSPIIGKIKKLSGILGDPRMKRSFKQFELHYFSVVWRVFYFFAKFRFSFGFYFMLLGMNWLRTILR